jgi:anti-sigma factor RsiW
MSCHDWRQLILEADPAELRGEKDSALGRHLTSCPHCRVEADRVLAGQDQLRDLLAAVRPRVPVEQALPDAVREAARRRRWWWWLRAAPLAAAAGIAGVLLFSNGGPTPTPVAERPPTMPPLVEAAPERDVVVYQTDNPDIVVVWFYQSNGSGT